jgi:hypothetical protein
MRSRPDDAVDRGAIDLSVQMLFGSMAVLFVLLLIVETVVFWHTRNVFDEAAAEGARVAAAFDGVCADGIAAANAMIERSASGWSSNIEIGCTAGVSVRVTVKGRSAGVFGFRAQAVETAPKEG